MFLVLVDDSADAGEKVMHSSANIITSLSVRGRHLICACWLLTQKLRVVFPNMPHELLLDADLVPKQQQIITVHPRRNW